MYERVSVPWTDHDTAVTAGGDAPVRLRQEGGPVRRCDLFAQKASELYLFEIDPFRQFRVLFEERTHIDEITRYDESILLTTSRDRATKRVYVDCANGEPILQHLSYEFRFRPPLRRLHHSADEKTERFFDLPFRSEQPLRGVRRERS